MSAPTRPRPLRLVLLALALAAAGVLLLRRCGGDDPSAGIVDHACLQREAAALAARHPDALGDLRPIPRIELFSTDGRTIRRGKPFVLLAPSGNLLGAPPEFRWEAANAAAPVEIELLDERGASVWRARAEAPPFRPTDLPELAPGARHLWRVVSAERRGSGLAQTFRVTTTRQKARFEAPAALIRTSGSPAAGLLVAHLAIRLDFPDEAEREARAFLAAHPGNAAALETLHFLLDRRGSREADTLDVRW